MGCAGGAIPGGLAGGPSGALVGCASGAYTAARARAAGEVINLAVGEQFDKVVSWVQDQAFDSIKNNYPTINDSDAINLVNLGILGLTDLGPEIKGFAKNTASGTLNAIKSFKDASGPKFAFADGFDAQNPHFDSGGDNLDMNLLFKKEYPDTVEKVNNRYPINADYAGQKYPTEKLSEDLQAKYPDSVQFDEKGFARFEPYAKISVQVEGLTGEHGQDFKLADKAAGLSERPAGYTWHHVEDTKTMILVPTKLHKAIPHTGGAAVLKGIKNE